MLQDAQTQYLKNYVGYFMWVYVTCGLHYTRTPGDGQIYLTSHAHSLTANKFIVNQRPDLA
jgi:hypothetical protein